ncbi:MAG: CCDC90 family protein [Magnetococcus sp. YQC-5]
MNTAFDTHKFIKRMMATGFSEAQAEEQVSLLMEILDHQLSTKADVARVDANVLDIKRDIALIEANLKRDIEETKTELKRDIEAIQTELKRDIEASQTELKRDIKEMDTKIETIRAELKRDLAEMETNLRKDMNLMETNLRKDMNLMESNLKRDIESSKVETIKWTAGMFVAQTAMIIGALFAVMKMVQPTGIPAPFAQEMRIPAPTHEQNTNKIPMPSASSTPRPTP